MLRFALCKARGIRVDEAAGCPGQRERGSSGEKREAKTDSCAGPIRAEGGAEACSDLLLSSQGELCALRCGAGSEARESAAVYVVRNGAYARRKTQQQTQHGAQHRMR